MRDDLFDARDLDNCFDVSFRVFERVAWVAELLCACLVACACISCANHRVGVGKINHGGIGFGVLG
jgi:hypothetical protein